MSGAPTRAAAQGPPTPEAIGAFFDDLIPGQLSSHHLPGAVVLVTYADEVIFTKGYGYANVEAQTPVDPETTLFRIGSITKLFTWTAVMKLVEQGKVDLDSDINTYLDFPIPDTFDQPITMRHLMSHSAGFEESNFECREPTLDEVIPHGMIGALQEQTLSAFVDRFFPASQESQPSSTALNDASAVAGFYRSVRSSYTKVEKATSLLSYARAVALPDGRLKLTTEMGSATYIEAQPYVFRQVDGDDTLAVSLDSRGRVQYLFQDAVPFRALERFPWYENPLLHQVILGIGFVTLGSVIVASGVRGLRRRRRASPPATVWLARADRALLVASVLAFAFAVLFVVAFLNQLAFVLGEVGVLGLALTCSTLVAVLSVVVVAGLVPVWRGSRRLGRRIHYTVSALALVAMTWSFAVWNLIGWRY